MNHQALFKCLQSENMINKFIKWQLSLSEFHLNIVHVLEKDLAITDELSRIVNALLTTFSMIENSLISFALKNVKVTTNILISEKNSNSKNVNISWKNDWKNWLNDSWYADIVKIKIIENCKTKEFLLEAFTKVTKKKSDKFVLIDEKSKELTYKKRNEKLSRCLHESEISKTLIFLHNVHDYFVEEITLRRTIDWFFWFIRHKDVTDFCRTYVNCQMSKSLKSSQELLFIISLQSLDIMNIDYIDFIIFIAKNEARFMCISVDYFTRYLFADVMSFVIFENTIIFFKRSVIQHFKWFRMIYFDNESHFEENFDSKLKK